MNRQTLLVIGSLAATTIIGCTDVTAPDDSSVPFSSPRRSVVGAADVSAGGYQSCTLRPSGIIECWGRPEIQGNPVTLGLTLTNVLPTSGSFVSVSADDWYNCGLRDDGVVECWQWFGPRYIKNPLAGSFVQLSAGPTSRHVAGSSLSVYRQHCAVRTDGVVECWRHAEPDNVVTYSTAVGFTQVSTGYAVRCALRTDGAVECWSIVADHPAAPALVEAESGRHFTQVAVRLNHSCALRDDGVLQCWGDPNGYGGESLTTAATGTFTQMTVGRFFTCALRSDGYVECLGNSPGSRAPSNGGTFVRVAAGDFHICGLRSDDLVECWGDNTRGQAHVDYTTAPSNLTATLTGGTIGLSWNDNSGDAADESRFEIQRQTNSSHWLSLPSAAANATSSVDALLIAGLSYRYRTRACNGIGCSAWVVSGWVVTGAVPAAPAALTAVFGSTTRIDLSWTDASSNETVFQIERRMKPAAGAWGRWTLNASPGVNVTSMADNTVTRGNYYQYRVQACNPARGCSAFATSASLLTEAPPLTPTNLSATPQPEGVDLTWTDASDNEDRFEVFRRSRLGDAWSSWTNVGLSSANVTSLTDGSAGAGSKHQYRMRACNVAGCSAFSTVARVTSP